VALGRTLGLTIIAEGIEDPGQFRRLAELGCEYGQGYLLSRPQEADAMTSMLRSRLPLHVADVPARPGRWQAPRPMTIDSVAG
jgi:predicted signal transduction protein with EAL and GGDEF domain